jgi:hypothetical protein
LEKSTLSEGQALESLSNYLQIPLPDSITHLRQIGLNSASLVGEVNKGIEASTTLTLAGLELVEISKVAELSDEQIICDHNAVRSTAIDGLSISWDLMHIPFDRLVKISTIWSK